MEFMSREKPEMIPTPRSDSACMSCGKAASGTVAASTARGYSDGNVKVVGIDVDNDVDDWRNVLVVVDCGRAPAEGMASGSHSKACVVTASLCRWLLIADNRERLIALRVLISDSSKENSNGEYCRVVCACVKALASIVANFFHSAMTWGKEEERRAEKMTSGMSAACWSWMCAWEREDDAAGRVGRVRGVAMRFTSLLVKLRVCAREWWSWRAAVSVSFTQLAASMNK